MPLASRCDAIRTPSKSFKTGRFDAFVGPLAHLNRKSAGHRSASHLHARPPTLLGSLDIPFPTLSSDQLDALIERQNLDVALETFDHLPRPGIVPTFYARREHLVLRVPKDNPKRFPVVDLFSCRCLTDADFTAGIRTVCPPTNGRPTSRLANI